MTQRVRPWSLAIDFGTTATAAAIADEGGRDPRPLNFGRDPFLSSVVAFEEGIGLITGQRAANQALAYPEQTEETPKRLLGETRLATIGGTGSEARAFSGAELVAAVLKTVLDESIRQRAGTMPTLVRLTHPAGWAQHRLDALSEAAVLAGIAHPVLGPPEPVAAATELANHASQTLDVGDCALVFDWGGGTLDIALVERVAGGFQLRPNSPPGGNPDLGGEDIDFLLLEHLIDQTEGVAPGAKAKLSAPPDAAWARAAVLLRLAARQAKEHLSDEPFWTVALPSPLTGQLIIRQAEFSVLIEPKVDDAVTAMYDVLGDAGVRPAEVALVFLVGGSSRLRLIGDKLARRFPERVVSVGDPKSVVALGAAALHGETNQEFVESPRDRTDVVVTEPGPPAQDPGPPRIPPPVADQPHQWSDDEPLEHTPAPVPFWRRFGWQIGAVVGGVALLVFIVTAPFGAGGGEESPTPVPTLPPDPAPPPVAPAGLEWGECFDSDGPPFTDFTVVDCVGPHVYEVFGTDIISEYEAYPGDDALSGTVDERCLNEFEDYVGISYGDSQWYQSVIYPSEETWAEGDRQLLCVLHTNDESAVTGTAYLDQR